MWGEDEQQKALKERFSQMSDEELLKIVCEEYEDYHETALRFAEEELNKRGIYLEDENESSKPAITLEPESADVETRATCAVCGGKMRVGNLFANKEVTILFPDEKEERFVDVLACEQCGQIKMIVDYETSVEA
jgi:uncharacterized protein with PIN domain